MTHLFEGYTEEDTMFATIEKSSELCFTSQGHSMLDDGREGKYGSIIEIQVIFVSEIEMSSGAADSIWLREIGSIGVCDKSHVTG